VTLLTQIDEEILTYAMWAKSEKRSKTELIRNEAKNRQAISAPSAPLRTLICMNIN
jgi:hypothetical protein